MNSQTTKFKIGHCAYSGRNAQKFVAGKTAAVSELMLRGVKRAAARQYINAVSQPTHGGYMVVPSLTIEIECLKGERIDIYAQCFI